MNKKSWLIILVIVLVAVGIYNHISLGPINPDCFYQRDGSLECGEDTDCPEGQKKCYSPDKGKFVCCGAKDICGTAPDDGGAKDKVWCVSTNPQCPSGTTLCKGKKAGSGTACCPAGFSCKTYSRAGTESAWCSPNSKNQCPPGHTFKSCTEDNICCARGKTPDCYAGYAWCSDSNCVIDDSCDSSDCPPGTTACGDDDVFKCCNNQNQICNTASYIDYCISTSCPQGQELCEGVTGQNYYAAICCPTGTCMAGSLGSPTCSNTWSYPPPVVIPEM